MATKNRRLTVPVTELEHSAFCTTEDDLPSKPLAEEMAVNVRWQQIPSDYLHYTAEELDIRISAARADGSPLFARSNAISSRTS